MTLADLIALFRIDANDIAAPFFWADEAVIGWLNEAQREAAIRGRLLREWSNPEICSIPVTAGTSAYTLHEAIYEIEYIAFKATGSTDTTILELISPLELSKRRADWRSATGDPLYAIQDETSLRIVPNPTSNGELSIEGFRLPIDGMQNDSDTPEIHAASHRNLILWALRCAFSVPDSEAFDKNRADRAEAAFTAYFGERPRSNLRRNTRTDVPQTVKAFMP